MINSNTGFYDLRKLKVICKQIYLPGWHRIVHVNLGAAVASNRLRIHISNKRLTTDGYFTNVESIVVIGTSRPYQRYSAGEYPDPTPDLGRAVPLQIVVETNPG